MKTRLLCLGLVAAVSQLFSTGCHGHAVARFRANHPCLSCGPAAHPLLHPIQTRRAILSDHVGPSYGPVVGEPVVGPLAGPVVPPCHGCSGGVPSVPVGYSGGPIEHTGYPPIVISSQGSPSIGSPMPIYPGPNNVLPHPNPMPPKQ